MPGHTQLQGQLQNGEGISKEETLGYMKKKEFRRYKSRGCREALSRCAVLALPGLAAQKAAEGEPAYLLRGPPG